MVYYLPLCSLLSFNTVTCLLQQLMIDCGFRLLANYFVAETDIFKITYIGCYQLFN